MKVKGYKIEIFKLLLDTLFYVLVSPNKLDLSTNFPKFLWFMVNFLFLGREKFYTVRYYFIKCNTNLVSSKNFILFVFYRNRLYVTMFKGFPFHITTTYIFL